MPNQATDLPFVLCLGLVLQRRRLDALVVLLKQERKVENENEDTSLYGTLPEFPKVSKIELGVPLYRAPSLEDHCSIC